MTISSTLTNLMNTVRSKYALSSKMSVADAANEIGKPSFNKVIGGLQNNNGNNSSVSKTKEGYKYTATSDDQIGYTGLVDAYDQTVIIPGMRYSFSVLIRGTIKIVLIGEEINRMSVNLTLDPNDWKRLTFNFIAKRDVIIYGKGNKNDWLEIKDPQYYEMGGIKRFLYSLVPHKSGGACYAA